MNVNVVHEDEVVETDRIPVSDTVAQAAGFIGVIRTHGVFVRRFNVAGVGAGSAVCVSISEVTQSSAGSAFDTPFIGDAVMRIDNVAPLNGGQVDVRGEVAWNSDLNVRINFIVS
jgi:hypothetical protein